MGKQAVNIYQDMVRKSKETLMKSQRLPVMGPALALAAEAGEVAGKVYKNMRDEKSDFGMLQQPLMKELGDCLFYITSCAQDLGYELEDVIDINYEKVKLRTETGTISGDGDDREVKS